DDACLSAIGREIQAHQLLVISLVRSETFYDLSMRLLNAETQQNDVQFLRQPPSLDKLKQTLERGVLVLFGWEKDESDVGVLAVKTKPPGASIQVNGKTVGTSPVTIRSVPIGEHTVTAKIEGHQSQQKVLIEDGEVSELTITVDIPPPPVPEPDAIRLKVNSQPAGARVYLDGAVVGIAPCIIESVTPGEHQLELELDKYQTQSEIIQIERPQDDKPIVYLAKLNPKPAQILLLGTPKGTVAILSATETKEQPIETCGWISNLCSPQLTVQPGKHKLVLKSPRHYAKELVFNAGAGTELEFNITMSELPLVRFHFPEDQPPADLEILVDRKPVTLLWDSNFLGVKTKPFVALEHGSYDLVVSGTGIKRYRERLIIHDVYSPNPEVTLETDAAQ
ncbi:MAG: PEGA domain-containing protein, partial [Myxococcota bacterium]|nr:PEGA domain-containing protein [Myxococcota bacterium]